MAKKQMIFKTKGMNKDLSVSIFSPEFSFENRNLRLVTNESNTLMSWVNEKGTKQILLYTPEYWSKSGKQNTYTNPNDESWTHHISALTTIEGNPIGTAIINEKLVLFTHKNSGTYPDYIYLLEYINKITPSMSCKQLFNGNLNFSIDNPLETLSSFESSEIQKVYWVDGINQPRMINICRPTEAYYETIDNVQTPINTYFDFVKELKLKEKVFVSKTFNSIGEFPAGVIQYAFTYYDKYGQESNIFYITPLQYISYYDRAGSPEDKINNAFNINIDNIDTRFEYIRIYSILRTSLNATPIVKRVQDIRISNPVNDVVTDTRTDYEKFLDSLGYEQNGSDVIKLGINSEDINSVLFSIASTPSEEQNNNTFIDIDAFVQNHNDIEYDLPSAGATFQESDPLPGTYPINEDWESQTPNEAETVNYNTDDGVTLEYEFDDVNNTAKLTKIILLNGASHVSIPAYVTEYGEECESDDEGAYEVTEIGENICDYTELTEDTSSAIEDEDTSTSGDSQNYADWLWWLRIPSTITKIHHNAFYGCNLLSNIWTEIENPVNVITGSETYTQFKDLFRYTTLPTEISLIIPDGTTSDYVSEGCEIDPNNTDEPVFYEIRELGALDPRFQYGKNKYYVIDQQSYPNLILKINKFYYTWESDSSDAIIYYYPAYTKFNKLGTNANNEEVVIGSLEGPLLICSKGTSTKVKSTLRVIKKVNKTQVSKNSISFIDTNTTGDIIDPTYLLYLNEDAITPYTLEQKDNTLFLGNFALKKTFGENNSLKTAIGEYTGITSSNLANNKVSCVLTRRPFNLPSRRIDDTTLSYMHTLSSPEGIAYQGASAFKSNEYYRLGIQFQDKLGKWTEPIWIGDKQWVASSNINGNYGPYMDETGTDNTVPEYEGMGIAALPEFILTIESASNIQQMASTLGYKKVRAVYVQPNFHDRTVLCQGVICPTVYRKCDRGYTEANGNEVTGNGIYAQSSWLFRSPFEPNPDSGYRDSYWNHNKEQWIGKLGGSVEYRDTLPTVFGIVKGADDIEEPGIKYEGEVHLGERAQPNNFYHGGNYYNGGSISDSVKDTWFHRNAWKYSGVWMPYYRSTEIMGYFSDEERYRIDNLLGTVHSPDIEFDPQTYNIDFNSVQIFDVGDLKLVHTYGDIDIRMKSAPILPGVRGFIHQSISTYGTSALISGNFYEDDIVTCDEIEDGVPKYKAMDYNEVEEDEDAVDNVFPYLWPVYMWHRKGSLNNDVTREGRTSELLKKKICNYRQSYFTNYYQQPTLRNHLDIKLYSDDEAYQVVKINGNVYQGCVDTMVIPSEPSDYYVIGLFNVTTWRNKVYSHIETVLPNWKAEFQDVPIVKLHQDDMYNPFKYSAYVATCGYNGSMPRINTRKPKSVTKDGSNWFSLSMDEEFKILSSKISNLTYFKDGIPIKYKSTPHIVVDLNKNEKEIWTWSQKNYSDYNDYISYTDIGKMSIVELRVPYDKDILYGGISNEALESAIWIPCGPPVDIDPTQDIQVPFKWGDTYFQRYECLKTYPYTDDDINQVIEIGSFILESRINIDGRYDRNRAQINNLHVSPTNFNKINKVYSQQDNFFNYRILPNEYYTNVTFPNQITWTKAKQNGADVDLWTNIVLSSTLEMDGNLGKVTKLLRLNNNLIAFQDKGIAQILYNENTQISTTEGTPVEVANSNKVQGKRYISNVIGCSNKWSIAAAAKGIYFIDSYTKSLYLFDDSIQNLSDAKGLNSWFKNNIPAPNINWTPTNNFNNFVSYWDKLNQDVLFIDKTEALAFSEKLGEFTSFYDYGNTPFFCNFEDTGIWIKSNGTIWKHNSGQYCRFFDENKPYGITLISNQEPQKDKIFTNIEFRACIDGEANITNIPFDYLETWNEYQHGFANLSSKDYTNGATQHHLKDNTASLNRKFRMWRCDIPRDNADITMDVGMNISRKNKHPMNRMRNPWLYVKLWKNAEVDDTSTTPIIYKNLPRTEIHDVVITYYS